jgi:glycine cleavage system H protein
MDVPADLKYTKNHEWVKIDGDVAKTGITEFAVKALSDLVYVDLPELEDLTEKGHPFAEVESVKAVADVYAPLSGEIATVNEELVDNLDHLAKDPYGKGWLATIKMSYPNEVEDLMDAEAYSKYLEEEAGKDGH